MLITDHEALTRVIDHREVFHDEMLTLMRRIMSGEMSPVMIAALAVGLRVKKESIGEIAAAATVMREFATPVPVADTEHLVDLCGTGGDAAHTFNISTTAMFVAAAAGARVAKHGGRSVSSTSGSADVLEALGGRIVRAQVQMHGKASEITTDRHGVFANLPERFNVIRYHSLAIERATLPAELAVSATTPDGESMGVRHRSLPVEGVQFHPESILTEHGHAMLKNFLAGAR